MAAPSHGPTDVCSVIFANFEKVKNNIYIVTDYSIWLLTVKNSQAGGHKNVEAHRIRQSQGYQNKTGHEHSLTLTGLKQLIITKYFVVYFTVKLCWKCIKCDTAGI